MTGKATASRRLTFTIAFGLVLVGACGRSEATDAGPLTVERTIPLPGVAGRIDHLALDPKRQRLFIAEVGAGALDAIDLATGARVARVDHLAEPQGVVYLPAFDEVAVANGGDGTVHFYAAANLAPAGVVQIEGDADNLRLRPSDGLLVAADGKGFAVIDPARRLVLSRADIGGHPEGFQLIEGGRLALANVPEQRRIVSVDLETGRQAASWSQGAWMNFPMAVSGAQAATMFRAPARLLAFDSRTGRRAARVKACGDSDDLFFDPRRPRLYVVCGSGAVQAFDTSAGYSSLGMVSTRSGARTGLFAPSLDRLFVAARAAGGEEAAILVLKPAAPAL